MLSELCLKSNILRSQIFEAFIFFLKKIMSLVCDRQTPIQNKRRRYIRGKKNADTTTISPTPGKGRKPLQTVSPRMQFCFLDQL